MFKLLTMPVTNKKELNRWLLSAAPPIASTSGVTILELTKSLEKIFPKEILIRFPEYAQAIHIALFLSFVGFMVSLVVKQMIAFSITQNCVVCSWFYIIYSMAGLFVPGYQLVFILIATIYVVCFYGVLFLQGVKWFLMDGSTCDKIVSVFIYVVFLFICLYPLTHLPYGGF